MGVVVWHPDVCACVCVTWVYVHNNTNPPHYCTNYTHHATHTICYTTHTHTHTTHPLQIRILNEEGAKADDNTADEMFLRKIESALLSNVALQGVEGIRKVFIREATKLSVDKDRGYNNSEKENILDTEGINLMAVMCHDMVCCWGWGGKVVSVVVVCCSCC